MNDVFILGITLFLGYIGAYLLSKWKIPAVTGYIVMGLILGVSLLHVIPLKKNLELAWLINIALILIAFNVGGELRIKELKKMGRFIGWVVIMESFMAFAFIFSFMRLFGGDINLSLIVASLGSATAPAATVLVLNELKAKGILTTTLLACVGLDDAIGITLYSFSSSTVQAFSGQHIHLSKIAWIIGVDMFTSIFIGIISGILLIFIMRTVSYDIQAIIVVTGTIFLSSGFLYGEYKGFHFSPLLSALITGFIFSNYSKRQMNVFRNLNFFGYPFYLIYFVLAGARLNVRYLLTLKWIAVGYLLGRFSGKYIGVFLGNRIGKGPKVIERYGGLGLISQAGIAIGLALMAANRFPHYGNEIIAIALGTTIVTEILGPILTKYAIVKAGERKKMF